MTNHTLAVWIAIVYGLAFLFAFLKELTTDPGSESAYGALLTVISLAATGLTLWLVARVW